MTASQAITPSKRRSCSPPQLSGRLDARDIMNGASEHVEVEGGFVQISLLLDGTVYPPQLKKKES